MKITIIHGQSHKGSTYHLAHLLAEKTGGEIREIFLPKDFNGFCVGCTACFTDSETKCPHYERLLPITDAIDSADVLIFASPVYVMHAAGAMKALLDHYGYRFMVHRPEEKMFSKQAVCISTAAGAGTNSTNKDMADSLFWWGAGRIYRFGAAVGATSWDGVSDRKKQAYEKKLSVLAGKIKKRQGRVKPGLKTRFMFNVMRMMQKKGWNEADANYWKAKGWTEKKRPWKK
ncbi:MAG TPA: flavin reductase [Ruminococcaceae bacterium]|nr:flavin reductase [Oscillospiraceae bacterium]